MTTGWIHLFEITNVCLFEIPTVYRTELGYLICGQFCSHGSSPVKWQRIAASESSIIFRLNGNLMDDSALILCEPSQIDVQSQSDAFG